MENYLEIPNMLFMTHAFDGVPKIRQVLGVHKWNVANNPPKTNGFWFIASVTQQIGYVDGKLSKCWFMQLKQK